jgi:hypothetical protein
MPNETGDIQTAQLSESAKKTDLNEYKNLFFVKKDGIVRTLQAASKTPNGQVYKDTDLQDLTFEDFLFLPNISPEQFSSTPTSFKVPGEDIEGHTVQTSGSSGVKKEIRYSKEGIISKLDQSLIDIINASKNPILLVDKDSVDSTSHTVLKRSFDVLTNQSVETKGFTFPDEALDTILESDSDLVYTYLNPTLVNLLLDGLIRLKEQGDARISQLMGRKFFLESGGDSMTIDQLKKWNSQIEQLFGTQPQENAIVVFYGLSEHLMVGRYDYKPDDSEIKYRVLDNKFCIVLDENGRPSLGKSGRLEVTSLLDSLTSIEGITVLPRYLTGDLATLFIENGRCFLTNIQRDPEKASFSVMGEKIFLNMLPGEFAKFGLENVKFKFQELNDNNRKALKITIIPKAQLDNPQAEEYIQKVRQVLLSQYPSLAISIQTGLIKLIIEIGTGNFEKTWKYLGKKEITPEEFDSI